MRRWKTRIGLGALAFAVGLLGFGTAPVVAQTGTTDTTDPTIVPPAAALVTAVRIVPFADRFDALQVTWTEPAQNEVTDDGGPLNGYRIYYAKTAFGADALQNALHKDVGVGVSGTVEGLDPGTEYHVRVAPKNKVGVGTPSTDTASGKTTDAKSPDRVTDVQAAAGDMTLTVSWSAPYSGHATLTISKYIVTYQTSKTATKAAGAEQMIEVTTTSALLANLTNDVMYDIYVKAVNSAKKTGPNSVKATGTPTAGTTTPTDPDDGDMDGDKDDGEDGDGMPAKGTPNAPTFKPMKATDTTNTSITASWNEPGSGGSPIIGYQVEYMKKGGTAMPLMETAEMMITISGLTASTEYHVRVRARNSYGPGAWSTYLALTTKAKAAGPTSKPVKMATPMVEAGDKMLMVSWTEPASEKDISHYLVDYKTTAAAAKWMTEPKSVTGMSYDITGLTNGMVYLVRVRAVDSAGGMGDWSDNGSGTPMMPTPALPVFGAIALAGALAAAGRRRIRQRLLASKQLRYLPKK